MKTPLFVLGAAALSAAFAASAASAATAPDVLQSYLRDAQAQADAQLAAAGVTARTGVVQAYVGADGRLKAIRIISPESPCAGDRDVNGAMRHVVLQDVPPELIDAKLSFALGDAVPAQAR